MNCPGCGEKNRDGARFCTYCGTTLALRCLVCDTELVVGGRFCDSCGTAVDPSIHAAPAAAAPAAAARKVVTVLFADLTGSTALEERMDAESVRSILDRFYVAMRTEVERHSGRVVKFTGDGVMAAFGVPDVHEDDASRAVDAALAMRNELEALASDLQLELSLKIGVNTGEVVVSDADDDVVGDAVNVASRLEGAAVAGEVLVGEDTWRLTRATSRYEPVEPLTLKGKSEPVPAYRLLSVDERTADSAAAPFVGREAELGRLLAVYQEAVDENAARLVTIIGAPGLGKTRLSRELMAEVADVARVRETRCDPAGESTFAPIADLMRAAVGISELDSENEVLEKLAARIPDSDPDRDRIASGAAAILGVGQPGSPEETFWAIRRLIEAAASAQPVVLVLDDIHWAEPLLLDLIEHLAEWIREAPVLIVGTARPELRDLRPSLAEGGRAAAVIALEGLDRAATAQLALNLLGADELPSELLAKIPASTEGNPLFVRELVRMLVADRVLQRTADGWTVTVDVDAIQVPPTIQSLLSARVDRLRSDERTIVELASVVGKEFYRGALVELAPAGVKDLVDGCLESLRRKELVEPAGTYWIDEPVYRFHHVLIRDAAYRRLLKESRADVHERVASWLEAKTAGVLGEHDELVGYHLEQAHEYKRQLGRPDEQLGGRAASLLGAAAQRALDRDDLPAAAALSGRALDRLSADDEARSELLLVRCESLLSMGDVSQGASALAEFEGLASSPRVRAWATCFSGHLANLTAPERWAETEERVGAAASELLALGDGAGAAKAHTVHAQALAKRGRFAECEAVLDDALTAARAANDRRRITATLGFLPHAVLWGPLTVSRAGGRCLDIVRLLRITTGSPAVEATSLRCQAVLEAFRGRTDAARRMLRSARATLTELGLEHELLDTEQFAGIVELVGGDASEAASHLRAAYEGYGRAGVDVLAAQSAALLARAHLQLGEDDEAATLVGTSERFASGDLKASVYGLAAKAELLARRGEFASARSFAEKAVDLASGTDALFDHGNALRSLAAVLRAAGDAAGAKGAEDGAFALFERKGATALLDGHESPVSSAADVQPTAAHGLENACARAVARLLDDVDVIDWETMAAAYSEQSIVDDRRRGLRSRRVGRDALIEHWRETERIAAGTRCTGTVLAVRGERLLLRRNLFRGARARSAFEVETLGVYELDDDGLVARQVAFDTDAVDDAFAELDERFATGEGVAAAECISLFGKVLRAVSSSDGDAMRSVLSADLVLVDHRPASLGTMERDEWVSSVLLISGELSSSYRPEAVAYLRVASNIVAFDVRVSGVTNDGAQFENAMYVVGRSDDGLIRQIEFYPPDQLDAALASFDELAQSSELERGPGPLENLATRTASASQVAFVQRDWEALRSLFAEDCVAHDLRSGVRVTVRGRDARIDEMKGAADVGAVTIDQHVLAIRGERLCLQRFTFSGAGEEPYQVEFLSVVEVDAEGRLIQTSRTDAQNIDLAFAELNERYIAGEGRLFASVIRASARPNNAFNRRDWDAYREAFTESVSMVDHRPVSLGPIADMDHLVDASRRLTEVIAGCKRHHVRYHALDADGYVAEFVVTGTNAGGAPVEWGSLIVGLVRDGLIDSYELYAIDALAAALERFDELRTQGDRVARLEIDPVDALDEAPARFRELRPMDRTGMRVENECTRLMARVSDLVRSGELEAVQSLYSEAFALDDRRPGLRSNVDGVEAAGLYARSFQLIGIREATESIISLRGERLCLIRFRLTDARGFEIGFIELIEIDDDGLVIAQVVFDPDDLDAAYEELDTRFIAGSGAGHADVIRVHPAMSRSVNERRWADVRALLGDDLVVRDHRPASLGEISADEWCSALRALTEAVPNFHASIPSYHELATDRWWAQMSNSGTNAGGGVVDFSFQSVGRVRDGKIVTFEIFPDSKHDEARGLFERLGPRPDGSPLENATTRLNEVIRQRIFVDGEWDAADQMIGDDVILDDRRHGVRSVGRGREAWVTNFKTVRDLGFSREGQGENIAIRGDRLALNEGWLEDADGNQLIAVQLTEVDDSGRACRFVWFDPDDRDAAVNELEARYIAGEGAPYADVLRGGAVQRDALRTADWAAYRALLDPDIVLVDNRHASLGEVNGVDGVIGALQALAPLIRGGLKPRIRTYHAIANDRALAEAVAMAVADHGGEVEMAHLRLQQWRDGRIVRMELFPNEALSEALARFDELGSRSDDFDELAGRVGPRENAASRAMRSVDRNLISGNPEASRSLYAEGVELYDVRAGVRLTLRGVDARIEDMRSAVEIGVRQVETTVVATRGDRLALHRLVFAGAGPDPYEVEFLSIAELDADGLITASYRFDGSNLAGAIELLEERFIAGEGAPYADHVRELGTVVRSVNARDWDAFTRTVATDVVLIDHRPASLGERHGPSALAESSRALVDLFTSFRLDIVAYEALAVGRSVIQVVGLGTDEYGGELEFGFYSVWRSRSGSTTRMEHFPLDRLDDALARFEELGRSETTSVVGGSAGPLENTAFRVVLSGQAAAMRQDWEAMAQMYSDEVVSDDRRAGLRSLVEGKDEVVAGTKVVFESGVGFREDLIATRGDSLSLSRSMATIDGWEIEAVHLTEVDESGRCRRLAWFDADDIDAAYDELDARFAEGEAAPIADTVRLMSSMVRAWNAEDWDTYASHFGSGFTFVDHRPMGVGVIHGVDEMMKLPMTMADVVRDIRHDIVAYPRIGSPVGVIEIHSSGTNAEGGPFENAYLHVMRIGDGVVQAADRFGLDQRDEAFALFEELRGERDSAPAKE